MRTAIVSDIHGNLDGLMAVLADAESQNCDRVVCLGDLVDGGDRNEDVVRFFRDRGITTVQGNHDEHPGAELPLDLRLYLRALPLTLVEDGIAFTHASPLSNIHKIRDADEAGNLFAECDYRRIFVGHVHIPLIFRQDRQEPGTALSLPVRYDDEIPLDASERYIVCVGAVGYSRDALFRLRYAIYDHSRDSLMFRAPEGPLFLW